METRRPEGLSHPTALTCESGNIGSAPSRLIYPVYTVYRNKFARVPSQGASTMERVFTGISGSQTGGQSVLDISLPELVQQGGSFSNWPLNLPPAGSQTMVPLN